AAALLFCVPLLPRFALAPRSKVLMPHLPRRRPRAAAMISACLVPYGIARASAPDMNQQGLTGSWYEQATDGQGFEVEVYPDFVAPGTGYVFMSWFTYDTVTGGPEHQRWYTLGGNVASGQAASLVIYQNTGGNF